MSHRQLLKRESQLSTHLVATILLFKKAETKLKNKQLLGNSESPVIFPLQLFGFQIKVSLLSTGRAGKPEQGVGWRLVRTERWGTRLGLRRKVKQEALPGGRDVGGQHGRGERGSEPPLRKCENVQTTQTRDQQPPTLHNEGHTGGPRAELGGLVRLQCE